MAIYTTYAQFRAGFSSNPVGADGFKAWPGANVASPVAVIVPSTITAFPFEIRAGITTDPVPGVDRFDWYLSQRTDVTTRQYFTVSRNDPLPDTRSDRISVGLTALATGLGYGSIPLSTTTILALFTDVEIYVYTRATGAIRHKSLLEALTGDA